MKELIEYILKSLTNFPDDVVITTQEEEDGTTVYLVKANPEDYGRIIGRRGNLIQAIRTIAKARAIKEHQRVMVRVLTDDENREQTVTTPATGETPAETTSVDDVVDENALDDNLI